MKQQKNPSADEMIKIQVGLSKIKDPTTKKERPYKYSDISKINTWVNAEEYVPIPFDLMHLAIENRLKTLAGWWNGQSWEGLRFKPEYKVTKWKRNIQHD